MAQCGASSAMIGLTLLLSSLLLMGFPAYAAAGRPRTRTLSLYPYSAHARELHQKASRLSKFSAPKEQILSQTGLNGNTSPAGGGGGGIISGDDVIPMPAVQPQQGVTWNVSFFHQRLDHFGFTAESEETYFPQKYIFWDAAWSGPQSGGPIFVYCGNEGPVEWFLDNAGWITEIAAEFGALVVGPEHRYYGDSVPFGSAEAAYRDVASRAYLTTEQALADMAILLTSLRKNLSAEGCPIVVFGGSYGGMMASWFRLKYPHVTIGAIASSAPILQYEGVVPTDVFYKIVSRDYSRESTTCFDFIRDSWSALRKLGASNSGLKKLQQKFGLCTAPSSVDEVVDWLADAYINLAMVDYPLPADFLAPLPAYPIRELCRRIDSLAEGADVLDRVVAGVAVYFNFTGAADCFHTGADPHGEDGWNFQACTEHCMPMSSNASNSMFETFEWDQAAFAEGCKGEFGVTPRPNWVTTHFGGMNIKEELRSFGSNIVFSNGELDPWSGGGVLENISDSILSLIIPDGAHHLDLRASTPDDPPSVVWQRGEEKKHIKKWLKEYWKAKDGHQSAADALPDSGWTISLFVVLLTSTTAAMLSAVMSGAAFVILMRSRGTGSLSFPLLSDTAA